MRLRCPRAWTTGRRVPAERKYATDAGLPARGRFRCWGGLSRRGTTQLLVSFLASARRPLLAHKPAMDLGTWPVSGWLSPLAARRRSADNQGIKLDVRVRSRPR
jgi:hypothetical protein